MNLAMLRAMAEEYDSVALVNSDVVLSRSLVSAANAVLRDDSTVASYTPWSNNVSIFSLPFPDASADLQSTANVDLIADALAQRFGTASAEVPTGVGYCMFMPTSAVREVGLMDPIFGRGYCEEVDWCQRARQAGYRHVLGLGSFAFHHGGATTREAGLLASGHTTVMAHEAIVDHRYPGYRGDVAEFWSGRLDRLPTDHAMRAIVARAASRLGYVLDVGHLPMSAPDAVVLQLTPDGTGPLTARFLGQEVTIPLTGPDPLATLVAEHGRPSRCRIFDRGPLADLTESWAAAATVPCTRTTPYPSRV
jgi:GT2 family glycosyltransferase